jgi:hypothetical protein
MNVKIGSLELEFQENERYKKSIREDSQYKDLEVD